MHFHAIEIDVVANPVIDDHDHAIPDVRFGGEAIGAGVADGADTDERWARFERMLSTPFLPDML